MVPAVAVEGDTEFSPKHRLNHPEIPVVSMNMVNHQDTLSATEQVFPRSLWSGAWWQANTSCQAGSAANITSTPGQISKWRAIGEWATSLMRKADAAVWTFENVRRIAPAFQGLPIAAVYPVHKHCKLAQPRFRFIGSSEVLDMPQYEGEDYTCHDALAKRNGWTHKTALGMVARNSFGPHHIGADNVSSLSTEYIPTSADRAILQGYKEEDLPECLASTPEMAARKMVADVIPPLLANKMAHAVYPHLRSKLSAKAESTTKGVGKDRPYLPTGQEGCGTGQRRCLHDECFCRRSLSTGGGG